MLFSVVGKRPEVTCVSQRDDERRQCVNEFFKVSSKMTQRLSQSHYYVTL